MCYEATHVNQQCNLQKTVIKQLRREILRIRFNGHLPQLDLPFNYDAHHNVVISAKHKYHTRSHSQCTPRILLGTLSVTRNYFTCAQQVPQVNYYNRLY